MLNYLDTNSWTIFLTWPQIVILSIFSSQYEWQRRFVAITFFSSKVIKIQFCVWGLTNHLTRLAFLMCVLEWIWSHPPKRNSGNNEGQHPRAILLHSEGALSEHKIIKGASYSSLWRCNFSNKSPQFVLFPHHPSPRSSFLYFFISPLLDTFVLCVEKQVFSTDRLAGEARYPKKSLG